LVANLYYNKGKGI